MGSKIKRSMSSTSFDEVMLSNPATGLSFEFIFIIITWAKLQQHAGHLLTLLNPRSRHRVTFGGAPIQILKTTCGNHGRHKKVARKLTNADGLA
ncbi:hypothetical protein TNCV_2028901 [Trichonephila clavipes]|nr:hypothetical protein TNCV_2028901 [Trichonephila clavipes]